MSDDGKPLGADTSTKPQRGAGTIAWGKRL